MARREKLDVTILSSKGQVVIPKPIREKLGVGPKTKFLVYGHKDSIVLKKLEIPNAVQELKDLYERIDSRIAKHGEMPSEEIEEIIQEYRSRRTQ